VVVTVGEHDLIDYAALAELSGRSVGALRVMRSRGQLPEPDAPGPRWRRETLAAFLAEGAPVSAGGPPAATEASSGPGPSVATPERSAPATAPPVPSRPFLGEDAEDRRRRSMTISDVLTCPHPVDDRKHTSYMVMCLRCGRRQSGRDSFTGGGYAAWTAGWQVTCPHPEAERISRPWGQSCGVCGSSVR